MDSGSYPWRLKTFIKTRFLGKVIMFEEILEFKVITLLCYGKQKTLSLQQQVPKAQVWTIVEVVTICLNSMVSTCVLNQLEVISCCLMLWWLSSTWFWPWNLSHIPLLMGVKHVTSLILNYKCWTKTCGRRWWRWSNLFYKFWEHLILVRFILCKHMLDPPYKSLQVVENYVGRGNAIRLASKYDMKEVNPLLMTFLKG